MSLGQIVTIAGFGVVAAGVLGVASIGLTLQFGVTNYINFAYGQIITVGAYLGYLLTQPPVGLPLPIAILGGSLGTAAVAFGLHRLVFSPFVSRRPQLLFALLVTFIVGFMLDDVFAIIFGTAYEQMPSFLLTNLSLVAGPLTLEWNQVIYLAIAVTSMLLIHSLLTYTKLGRSMRAMSDDAALAIACGLNVRWIADATWLITGFMAGLAGCILAMQTRTFNINLGDLYIFLVFAAVIVGGIGRAYGALIGAAIIGLGSQLSVLFVPSAVTVVFTFAILVVIMLVRPQGLLGAAPSPLMER